MGMSRGRGIWAWALLLGGAGVAATAALQATNLVAHLPLEEQASPSDDLVGTADGVWGGAPLSTTTVPGAIAAFSTRSMTFSTAGADNYVTVTNTPALENLQENNYTVMAWYNPASIPPHADTTNHTDSNHAIVIKTGYHEGLSFNDQGWFVFEHWVLDATAAPQDKWLSDFVARATGQWYHVAGVVDRTNGVSRLYVNGALTATSNPIPWAELANAPAREFGTSTWKIGIANPSAGYEWQADGMIDDVRFYDRVLTLAEIQAIHAGTDMGAATPPAPTLPPPAPTPPPPPHTTPQSEGLLDDKCECGTVGVPVDLLPWAAAAVGLLAAALVALKRRP
jgi:hypothetical protein